MHAAGAWSLELAVVDVHLQPLDAGAGRFGRRLRFDGLRLGCSYAGLGRADLSAGGGQRSLGTLQAGQIVIQSLLRQGVALDQRGAARVTFARGIQLSLALVHHGLGGKFFALAQADLAGGGDLAILCLAQLGAGLGQLGFEHLGVHARENLAGLDEVTFVDFDAGDAPGEFGRHIHFGGFDAPVTAGEPLAQACRAQLPPGHGGQDGDAAGDQIGQAAFCVGHLGFPVALHGWRLSRHFHCLPDAPQGA